MMLIPIFIGINKSIYKSVGIKKLFWLLVVSFCIEVLNLILMRQKINTVSIFNSFTILEFVFLSSFYANFFYGIKRSHLNTIVLIAFVIVALLDFILVSGFKKVNTITISVESITLIIYSLVSFYFIMSEMLYENILEESFFWINIAVLFYFSGSLFLFIFSNYLMQQGNKLFMDTYKIHTFVNAVWYLFISIGFWKVKKA